jgi:hypothetical protein
MRHCLLATLRTRTGLDALSTLRLLPQVAATLPVLLGLVCVALIVAVLVPRAPRRRLETPVPAPEPVPDTLCPAYAAWSESLILPPARTPLPLVDARGECVEPQEVTMITTPKTPWCCAPSPLDDVLAGVAVAQDRRERRGRRLARVACNEVERPAAVDPGKVDRILTRLEEYAEMKRTVPLGSLSVKRLRQLAVAAGHKGSRMMRRTELLALLAKE